MGPLGRCQDSLVPRTQRNFHRLLAEVTCQTRCALVADSTPWQKLPAIEALRDAVSTAFARRILDDEIASHFVEAIVSARVASRLAGPSFYESRAPAWLSQQMAAPLAGVFESAFAPPEQQPCEPLRECLRQVDEAVRNFARAGSLRDDPAPDNWGDVAAFPYYHFLEPLLQALDTRKRLRRGVYYTPPAVVATLVRSLHESLQGEFGLSRGLADNATWNDVQARNPAWSVPPTVVGEDAFLTILDPACGTGAFLVEVVHLIHREWTDFGVVQRGTQTSVVEWNDYVVDRLLPRLHGFELMPAAAAVAQVAVAAQLLATGFDFRRPGRIHVTIKDTLADPGLGPGQESSPRDASCSPVTVVLGNPPYSALSTNRGEWIVALLKGKTPGGIAAANYFQVDGQPLGERKQWLHDDYVKFLRYAHWRIEVSDCGIVGLVTNHGYLDNATFRGVRQQLMRTFTKISVLDLHGSHKNQERSPTGGSDENLFPIEQGVALGLFCRPPGPAGDGEIKHGELWGTRRDKTTSLHGQTLRTLASSRVGPQSPFYFFAPRDNARRAEYEHGFRLPDIMPVHSTAAVTARDGFVVALDESELAERLEAFRDLSIDDAEIRERYFNNSRSPRYAAGDTRGWKLAQARARLAADSAWRERVRTCCYRPFDRRPIFWADGMVDWPRNEVSQHLLPGNNLALVARRQMLPGRPCNFFWIADTLVLDGLIRSDNRGSESVFPLYLNAKPSAARAGNRSVNLSAPFVAALEGATGLRWMSTGVQDPDSFGPQDVLHCFYAQFHSAVYRERYAEWLRVDFPRVFIPRQAQLFRTLSDLGAALVRGHLLTHGSTTREAHFVGEPRVGSGFPKYDGHRVLLNEDAWFGPVAEAVWQFHVGAHQVASKWLKDRRGRTLSIQDVTTYQRLLAGVTATLTIAGCIDEAIAAAGGWPGAFLPQPAA